MQTGKWKRTASRGVALLTVAMFVACGGTGDGSPKPTVTISTTPASVARGDSVVIQWSATDATDCIASGDWDGKRASSGTESYLSGRSGAMYFMLECSGKGGTAANKAKLTVYRTVSASN